MDIEAAKELIRWYQEIGASEPIGDSAVNRYCSKPAFSGTHASQLAASGSPVTLAAPTDSGAKERNWLLREAEFVELPTKSNQLESMGSNLETAVQEAVELASAATDLDALHRALASFKHSELKEGAHNLVFSDGNEAAEVMIVGEAPGRNEDLEGKPFVGQSGHLLDRMFQAINLDRKAKERNAALYITNVVPWRPPGNRNPTAAEIQMFEPFVKRHIELIQPRVLVLMGNSSCSAMLGKTGITKLRGQWHEHHGIPVMPMFHPAFHLRNPNSKANAWRDLLAIQRRLRDIPS